MGHLAKRGALIGLAVGLAALAGLFAATVRCLPFRISSSPQPWYCSDPAYSILGYFAFPVNLITNDLAQAVFWAPLSLATYTALGALIAAALGTGRSSAPGSKGP